LNGILDAVFIIHSGYAAEIIGKDCTNDALSSQRIQSIARTAIPGIWTTITNSFRVEIGSFAIASGLNGVCGSDMARMGVITHEFFHLFGVHDFYDLGGTGTGSSVGGLGAFDIMAWPRGPLNRAAFPGHLSPYSKVQLKTIEPIEIMYNGEYEARASEFYPDVFKISVGFAEGEYLLIENRQPTLFDQDLFGTGGILIYHVDENTEGVGNQFEGYPGMNGWPGNNQHFRVGLLSADRKYDLEKGVNNGDEGDFWKNGDTLGPGPGLSEAADFSLYPNTDSYSGGNIMVTGITITDFTETTPGVWTFRVGGLEGIPDNDDSFGNQNDDGLSSFSPSNNLTVSPSSISSFKPSDTPSLSPSVSPSWMPTVSSHPSSSPTPEPTSTPSLWPTVSVLPSDVPSLSTAPSAIPVAPTSQLRGNELRGGDDASGSDSSPQSQMDVVIFASGLTIFLHLFL
jgi:hypothetical protein